MADSRRTSDKAWVLACVLASSQPTYPFYVWLAAGEGVWRSAIVLVAIPFFLGAGWAAPALLPLVGILNALLAAWLMGREAGLDYLLVPCAMLAAVLLPAPRRIAMLALVAAAAAAWLLMDALPPGDLSASAYAALRRMNAISAILVCGLIGWISPPALPPPPAAAGDSSAR